MTQTITISRSDLKAKNYKAYSVTTKGILPKQRNTTPLAKVLKIILQK